MEQAKQELKNLMNELFVEDLRRKADQLIYEMANQFQGAVNDFSNEYQNLVNKSALNVIEPIVKKYFDNLRSEYSEKHIAVIHELEKSKNYVDDRFEALVSEDSPLITKIAETSILINNIKTEVTNLEAKNNENFNKTSELLDGVAAKDENISLEIRTGTQNILSTIDSKTAEILGSEKLIQIDIMQSKSDVGKQISELNDSAVKVVEASKDGVIKEVINTNSILEEKYNSLHDEINRHSRLLNKSNMLLGIVIVEIIVMIVLLLK